MRAFPVVELLLPVCQFLFCRCQGCALRRNLAVESFSALVEIPLKLHYHLVYGRVPFCYFSRNIRSPVALDWTERVPPVCTLNDSTRRNGYFSSVEITRPILCASAILAISAVVPSHEHDGTEIFARQAPS